jgi:hypothetical protein
MSDGSKDLFGKIDALFEKRAPDALVDKGLEYEDFPVLTEVIGTAVDAPVSWGEPERRVFDRRRPGQAAPTHGGEERRLEARRSADNPPVLQCPPVNVATDSQNQESALPQGMEDRLADLFIRQQLRLEEIVRKVVREELDKRL